VKIGDRLQIAERNTNLLAALTAPIWCLSPIFTRVWQLRGSRLRHRVGTVKEEDRNLVVWLVADVDGTMNSGGGLVPIRLAGADLDATGVAAIAVLDCQGIAAHHNSHPVERVAVPSCGFARLKAQSTNEAGSALMEYLLDHEFSGGSVNAVAS
jgi:hypothetical protein